MKKTMRWSLLVVMALLVFGLLSGCTPAEMELLNASIKTQSVQSMEFTGEGSIQFEVTGLTEEEDQIAQEMLAMFQNSRISVDGKMIQSEDGTVNKTYLKETMDMGGMAFTMEMWMDLNLNGDQPRMRHIMKMPKPFMEMDPQTAAKEYMFMDFDASSTSEDPFAAMVSGGWLNGSALNKLLADFATRFEPGMATVTRKGTQRIDGENLTIYELKLDDGAFKKVLRAFVNEVAQDETTIQDFLSLFGEIDSESEFSDPEELNAFIEEGLVFINQFLDTLEGVQILGDRGMTLENGVNREGYTVYTKGTIDLIIDFKALEEIFTSTDPTYPEPGIMPAGTLKLGIDYTLHYDNINGDVKVTIPILNPENSVNIDEMMPDVILMEDEITVIIDDEFLDSDVAPTRVNGRVMVPVRAIFQALGAEVYWDEATRTVTGVKGERTVVLQIDSVNASVNGQTRVLDVPATIIDGRTFVPVRFISEALGARVEWIEEYLLVIITSKENLILA